MGLSQKKEMPGISGYFHGENYDQLLDSLVLLKMFSHLNPLRLVLGGVTEFPASEGTFLEQQRSAKWTMPRQLQRICVEWNPLWIELLFILPYSRYYCLFYLVYKAIMKMINLRAPLVVLLLLLLNFLFEQLLLTNNTLGLTDPGTKNQRDKETQSERHQPTWLSNWRLDWKSAPWLCVLPPWPSALDPPWSFSLLGFSSLPDKWVCTRKEIAR